MLNRFLLRLIMLVRSTEQQEQQLWQVCVCVCVQTLQRYLIVKFKRKRNAYNAK